jgi:two-component system, NarL family, nitrate/nitrite response regulator NarL
MCAFVTKLRTAVVSEDPLARSGLAALIASRDDVVVAGGLAPDDLEALRRLGAEAALYDCSAHDPGSARALAQALPTVALAATASQGADALASGARAVLFRDASPDRIAAALRAAASGLVALDEGLAGWLRPPAELTQAPAGGLTPREAEVLALLAEGLANKAIAQRLGVSERTAKFHVESILGKLGAESRSEAIVLAARRGMITL